MAKKTRKPPRAPKLTARQRAADQNPLYDPATTLAGHRLSDAADAIANSEFGPKLAALGRQARSTETQGGALIDRAGDYFSQLATRSGKALDTQAAVAQQLRAGLTNVAAAASGATDQAQASVLDRLAADRAQRGAGLEGGGDRAVMDELAAQRANQAATAQGFQSAGELQGSRAAELQAELAAATQAHGGELHGQLVNRLANDLAKFRGERSDLEAQRGDERVKQLAALRQQGFENLVTTRGLGLKQEQLAADVANQQSQADLATQRLLASDRHNRATERNQRSSTRLQGESLAERQRHNAVLEDLSRLRVDIQQQRADAPKGGKGGKETAGAVKIKRGIQNTLTILEDGSHSERYLTKTVGVPPDVMQAAKDLKQFHYLQYDTVAQLEALGVQIPARWKPPRPDRTAPH
jgi:hypothetical protein